MGLLVTEVSTGLLVKGTSDLLQWVVVDSSVGTITVRVTSLLVAVKSPLTVTVLRGASVVFTNIVLVLNTDTAGVEVATTTVCEVCTAEAVNTRISVLVWILTTVLVKFLVFEVGTGSGVTDTGLTAVVVNGT
jgi:hypothetical protein